MFPFRPSRPLCGQEGLPRANALSSPSSSLRNLSGRFGWGQNGLQALAPPATKWRLTRRVRGAAFIG